MTLLLIWLWRVTCLLSDDNIFIKFLPRMTDRQGLNKKVPFKFRCTKFGLMYRLWVRPHTCVTLILYPFKMNSNSASFSNAALLKVIQDNSLPTSCLMISNNYFLTCPLHHLIKVCKMQEIFVSNSKWKLWGLLTSKVQ